MRRERKWRKVEEERKIGRKEGKGKIENESRKEGNEKQVETGKENVDLRKGKKKRRKGNKSWTKRSEVYRRKVKKKK